ncbi:MAG: hypothetical protein ACREBS_05320 [Nitrososphaerales archaeon]
MNNLATKRTGFAIGKMSLVLIIIVVMVGGIGLGYALNSTPATVATTTQTETATTVSNYTVTQTTPFVFSPFEYTIYLSTCGGSYNPCFSDFSNAYVFNCLKAAGTSSGCTQLVLNSSKPQINYTITVWFPYTYPPSVQLNPINGTSWINCMYAATLLSGQNIGPDYQYCVPMNSTAFLVSQEGGGPLA